MDVEVSEIEATTSKVIEDPDKAEDDFDINEIAQLDEILGASNAANVKLLDFERQMFLDCVYNDGLVICGK